MKRRAFLIGLIVAAVALLAVSLLAAAQDGRQAPGAGYQVARSGHQVARSGHQVARSGYDLSWWTVDGGGYTFMTGGGYSLGGTAGQADAGLLTGGRYTLGGGFWRGGAVAGSLYEVYLPLVLRRSP